MSWIKLEKYSSGHVARMPDGAARVVDDPKALARAVFDAAALGEPNAAPDDGLVLRLEQIDGGVIITPPSGSPVLAREDDERLGERLLAALSQPSSDRIVDAARPDPTAAPEEAVEVEFMGVSLGSYSEGEIEGARVVGRSLLGLVKGLSSLGKVQGK